MLPGLPGGALLGGVVAAEWLPILGWRGMFLLGGVLPVIMIAVMFFCPESPGYLVARGRPGDQTKARMLIHQATKVPVDQSTALVPELGGRSRGSIAALFDQKYRATTIAVGAVYLANWIAWFLLLQWMPTALHMLGLSTSDAAFGTIVVNGAFILFSFPISFLLPRVQLRKLLLGMFTVGILVSLGLGLAGSQWTVIFVLIALAGLGIGGQQLVLNYLVAGTYSTELRGVATGFSIGVGRLGSIVGSALGGTLLAAFGPNGYFAVLAVPLAVAAIATVLVRAPKTPSSH
ncbi:MFS transporter [Kocuria palustris]|uniref:MFS transporter n=1 Tax=Kocuria palustris TaxID=71999 RepID=UPI0030B8E741